MCSPFTPLSFSSTLTSPLFAIVHLSGESWKKKTPLQQYALPPALRRGRQKPRNQRRAHVTSHCAPLNCSLPALACFLAEVIVNQPGPSPPPPPPTPTTKLARLWGGNAHILPHTSGARTHGVQGFMAVTFKPDSFPLLPAFRETCICFFSRRSRTRRRFAGGAQSFNYVYSKIPPVKNAVQ